MTDTLPRWVHWTDGELAVLDLWVVKIRAGMPRRAAARRLHQTCMSHRSVGALVVALTKAGLP